MALYNVTTQDSLLKAVETIPMAERNVSIFYPRDKARLDAVKEWLALEPLAQKTVAVTHIGEQPVIVTSGAQSGEALFKTLESMGSPLALQREKEGLQPWKIRSALSNTGQILNLYSAWKKPGGIAVDKMMFAGLNFTASWINDKFGAQKEPDHHRLDYLRNGINAIIDPDGVHNLPTVAPDHSLAKALKDPAPPLSLQDRASQIITNNSVRINIGLRYMGSIAMAFPIKNWASAWTKLQEGSVAGAASAACNNDKTNFLTGVAYLAGKTISLFSKVPDPYNPKKSTGLDAFREQHVFHIASVIEGLAATTLAVGNFKKNKKGERDILGGVAGTVLTGGLVSRFFAPFGTKELDIEEVYAYATQAIAKMPPESITQSVSDTAAFISEDTKLKYGEVFSRIMTDLYRHHHITFALDALPSQIEKMQEVAAPTAKKIAFASQPETSMLDRVYYKDMPNGKAIIQDTGANRQLSYA